VFVPIAKDICYFSHAYEKGLDWYSNFFIDVAESQSAVGEISVNYCHNATAIERIAKDLPNVKLLLSVRNPMNRAWSAYTFLKRNGKSPGTFREKIDSRSTFVFEAGCYAKQIEVIEKYFPGDRLKIAFYDDLESDPHAFGQDIYRFLDVDQEFIYEKAERNSLPASEPRSRRIARYVNWSARRARQLGLANLIGRLKSNQSIMNLLFQPIDKKEKEFMSKDDWLYLSGKYRHEIEALAVRTNRRLENWFEYPGQ
jgi:hypothetical protein